MFLLNAHPDYKKPLEADAAEAFGADAVAQVERFFVFQHAIRVTPLVALPGLADRLGIAALHVKDESARLDLGSFKALGGAYAVLRLVLNEATRRLGRPATDFDDLR